jgi:hypothetical protein
MHPADEGTMLSFMVRRGTLRGNPRTGNTFHDIPGHLTGVTLDNEVSRRIDDAYPWSRLVEAGDVELVRFHVHRAKRGELNIVIQYKNRRLDPTRVRTVGQ